MTGKEGFARAVVKSIARGVIRGLRKRLQESKTEITIDVLQSGVKVNLNRVAERALDYADKPVKKRGKVKKGD